MGSTLCVMFLTFSVVILSNTEVRVLQAQNETSSALLEWKASLDLQSQLTLVSWDRNNPCQSWLGINCSLTPQSEWVVTDIRLSNSRLNGSLDSFNFSSFRHLEVLRLSNNSLFGSVPSNIADLSQLRILILSVNHLSGVIPSEIGMLPFLEGLYLYTNRLTGHIPNSIGNLTNLIDLDLYGNELTGSIPQEIGMLAKLEFLHFGSNNLTGEIPSSLGNLTHLYYLYLSDNQLSGTIPPELGGAKDLIFLDISYNHLSGSLYLSFNNLSGSFPKDINLSKITWLFVDNNRLSGPLPRVGKLVMEFVASNVAKIELGGRLIGD